MLIAISLLMALTSCGTKIKIVVSLVGQDFMDSRIRQEVLVERESLIKGCLLYTSKGAVFRGEEVVSDIYEGIDRVVDKLSSQMSRFKGKLQKRYNDNKSVRFEGLPEMEEEVEEVKIVRTKKFELRPMTVEEAVLEMEMLQHSFFVFLDMETDSVNVVYRRKDGNYGVLETTY